MSKNKFPKSVSFNTKNKKDREMLEFLNGKIFSGYVKKLIWDDMKKIDINVSNSPQATDQQPPLSKYELLRRQLTSAKHVNRNPQSNSNTQSDSEEHK